MVPQDRLGPELVVPVERHTLGNAGLEFVAELLQQHSHVDQTGGDADAAGLQLREFEGGVDEIDELRAGVLNMGDHVLLCRHERLERPIHEQLDVAGDDGDGGAQLVRYDGENIGFEPARLLHVRNHRAQEVALRDDPDQPPVLVDDRQPPEGTRPDQLERFERARLLGHGVHRRRHHVADPKRGGVTPRREDLAHEVALGHDADRRRSIADHDAADGPPGHDADGLEQRDVGADRRDLRGHQSADRPHPNTNIGRHVVEYKGGEASTS